MKHSEFEKLFDEVTGGEMPGGRYANPRMFEYTKHNRERYIRLLKSLDLGQDLMETLKKISKPQHWIVITEPWCGDCSQSLPFIARMTEQNALINFEVELRDSEPYTIENYWTDGKRAIPKLIVRNEDGNDLFTWGSRPQEVQKLFLQMKADKVPFDILNPRMQQWYRDDNGQSLCQEVNALLRFAIE